MSQFLASLQEEAEGKAGSGFRQVKIAAHGALSLAVLLSGTAVVTGSIDSLQIAAVIGLLGHIALAVFRVKVWRYAAKLAYNRTMTQSYNWRMNCYLLLLVINVMLCLFVVL